VNMAVRASRRTAVVLAMIIAVISPPTQSWAQAGVAVSTDPTGGEALGRSPATIRLLFDRAPDPAQSHLGIADDSGARLAEGEVSMDGPHGLRQPMRATEGNVAVAYHVVFTDGSETFGSFRFSVGTGLATRTTDRRAEKAAESVVLGHQHSIDPISAVLLVVDFLVAAGVVLLLMLRPRRRSNLRQVLAGEDPSETPR
jgi:methionine-rich copper-binding protein CopC